jgi:hypothetical protein
MAIHGAAVYGPRSAAIILGRSGSGKTTLTVALSRRRLLVASDDVTFIDPKTLTLEPVPRCFHLDGTSVDLLKSDGFQFPACWNEFRFMAPADISPGSVPIRKADCLIFMVGSRKEKPELVAMSQAEMVGRVLSETGKSKHPERDEVAALTRLAGSLSCFRLEPGPLTETADAVASLLLEQRLV